MQVADMFPNLRGRVKLAFSTPEDAALAHCDVVFFATPNGVAMQQVRALLDAGVRVIDLAADFRIKDIAVWEQWYKMKHDCPDLVPEAVYGLPEINRDKIRGARLIANRLHPTAAVSATGPARRYGSGSGAKSGVSARGSRKHPRRGGGQLQGTLSAVIALAGDQAGAGDLCRQAGRFHLCAAPDAADPRHPRDAVREADRRHRPAEPV
jgi:N-acetyl-gamma-glutamylphosphate reductase